MGTALALVLVAGAEEGMAPDDSVLAQHAASEGEAQGCGKPSLLLERAP
ncbi:MAG: hypothetical protein H7Y39_03120 [Nitrospiraceae bacterium]|nr:hypothetical protein [Nitrospiraceae bacterium]